MTGAIGDSAPDPLDPREEEDERREERERSDRAMEFADMAVYGYSVTDTEGHRVDPRLLFGTKEGEK